MTYLVEVCYDFIEQSQTSDAVKEVLSVEFGEVADGREQHARLGTVHAVEILNNHPQHVFNGVFGRTHDKI